MIDSHMKKINKTAKGNELENDFYKYLINLQNTGQDILGTLSPDYCKILKKKKYYSERRQREIEFDIVIEIYRKGASEPQFRVFFECKNYATSIPETEVTDFSHKLSDIGLHDTKAFIVTKTKLANGAFNLANSEKIGVIKYDVNGLDFILERSGLNLFSEKTIGNSILENKTYNKSLKFSAYYDNKYFDSFHNIISYLNEDDAFPIEHSQRVPFISFEKIENLVSSLLSRINYMGGAVNLDEICKQLNIFVKKSNEISQTSDGQNILGRVNFINNKIVIFDHENIFRERFTLSHEIGHFALKHDAFLTCESVIEEDLTFNTNENKLNEIERMEYQANYFASCLLLPEIEFKKSVEYSRLKFDIRDKGWGYIYVDDQIDNLRDYHNLLDDIASTFKTSKQVVEIRLKKFNLVGDYRK